MPQQTSSATGSTNFTTTDLAALGFSGGLQVIDVSNPSESKFQDGFDAEQVQIAGSFYFGAIDITGFDYSATGTNSVGFPYQLNDFSGHTLAEWRMRRDWDNNNYLNWVVWGNDGQATISEDILIRPGGDNDLIVGPTGDGIFVEYVVNHYSHHEVNWSHLTYRKGATKTRESIVESTKPYGRVDEIKFLTDPDPVTRLLEVTHDSLELRGVEHFVDFFNEPSVSIKISTPNLSGTSFFFYDDIISADYSYVLDGGCDLGKFTLAIPDIHGDAFYGVPVKNAYFAQATGLGQFSGSYQNWTQNFSNHLIPASAAVEGVSGGGPLNYVSGQVNPTFRSQSQYDKIYIYQDTRLQKFKNYRLSCKYAGDSDSFYGIFMEVRNLARDLWWDNSTKTWTGEQTTNNYDYSVDWTTAELEFNTQDTQIPSNSEFRLTIGSQSGSDDAQNIGIAQVELQCQNLSLVREDILGLQSLGRLEVWGTDELSRVQTHPIDGRETPERRKYVGIIDKIESERDAIQIVTKGYSSLLQDRLVNETFSGIAASSIVQSIINSVVDVADTTGLCTGTSIGEIGDDPLDKLLTLEFQNQDLGSCIQDVIDQIPAEIQWGINADRIFVFRALPNPYPVESEDETNIYNISLAGDVSQYQQSVDYSRMINRLRIINNDEDLSVSAQVESQRSIEKFGLRYREEENTDVERDGDAAKLAQLIVAQDSKPELSFNVRREGDLFFELERQELVSPVMVSDGTKRGYLYGSDGKIFADQTAYGASLLFYPNESQYCTLTPDVQIAKTGEYFVRWVTLLGNEPAGFTGCAICNGTTGAGFIRAEYCSPAGNDLQLDIYAETAGAPGQWTLVWQKNFGTTSTFLTNTAWVVSKVDDASGLQVYAGNAVPTVRSPDYSVVYSHENDSSGDWVLGAAYSDTPGNFYSGKMDEVSVCRREYNPETIAYGGDGIGLRRFNRMAGRELMFWVSFDDTADPIYWIGQDTATKGTTYGTVSRFPTNNKPAFTNSIVQYAGTGLKYGEGQKYGSYFLLIPREIRRSLRSKRGWTTTIDLGAVKPNLGDTLDALDRALDRQKDINKS